MAFTRVGQQRRSAIVTLQAPTGGLNDIDPIALMDPKYCLVGHNWEPSNTALVTRKGYKEWVTNLPGAVNAVVNYAAFDGSEELFAHSAGAIYDATYETDAPVSLVSLAGDRISFSQIANAGNAFLVCAGNSTAAPVLYDGVSWTPFVEVFVPPVSPGEVSGADPTLWDRVLLYKRRLWFVEKNSLTAWYLPVDAVAGAATAFPLDGIFQRGGYLYDVAAWTFNANDGLAQKLVFRSSMGEVAVYSGEDPDATFGDPGAFELEAVYYVSPPVGAVPSADLGGDLVMLTQLGAVSLNSLATGPLTESAYDNALSRNISKTLATLSRTGEPATWEIHALNQYNAMVVSIPGPGAPVQYVLNTITGAWGTFDLPAQCFGQQKSRMFFGTADGRVCEFGQVQQDNVPLYGTTGLEISSYLFSAFNPLGDLAQLKSMKFVRPFIQGSAAQIRFALDVRMDYDVSQFVINPDNPDFVTTASFWDQALWDQGVWSLQNNTITPWVGVSGLGYAAAIVFKVATQVQLTFSAFQVVFEPGASL